jgi:cytochrome b pre-mRNA-processing protein 3
MLSRLFRKPANINPVPLYMALIAWARDPWFFTAGQVPDTLDGRYDMMALMVSLALRRLERDGEAHRAFGAALMETFVADMDESMREVGVGDLGVGKHVRRMAEGFVGRYGAYRAAESEADWQAALGRNLYRDVVAVPPALLLRIAALQEQLNSLHDDDIIAGHIGTLP